MSAKIVVGAGGSGKLQVVIDSKHIEEFCVFVYHQLKNFNFSQKQIESYFSDVGLHTLNIALVATLWSGSKLINYAQNVAQTFTQWYGDLMNNKSISKAIEQLADNINKSPRFLKSLTPGAKGRVLYQLARYFPLTTQPSAAPSQAIIHILSYIQSAEEFLLVLEHVVATEPNSPAITTSAIEGWKFLLKNIAFADETYLDQILDIHLGQNKNQLSAIKQSWNQHFDICVQSLHQQFILNKDEIYAHGYLYVIEQLLLTAKHCRDVALDNQQQNKIEYLTSQLNSLHDASEAFNAMVNSQTYSQYRSLFMR